ncbi:MAG: YbjN domain-containing protein [Halobacteriales archaeon]|nr:YbjN domain-containing protein [Halobacteriales archaeon]
MGLLKTPVEKARSLAHDAIRALGAQPDQATIGPDTWLLGKSSAAVVLRILPQGEEKAFIQVASPVMKVPVAPNFHARLTQLNYDMAGLCAFCTTPAGEVHLLTSRSVEGLSAAEIAQLVTQVAYFSDLYDDALLEEFGRDLALHDAQRRKR